MNSRKSSPKNEKTRNKAEKELQESHVFYKHLAEVTPEAVVIHSEGKIVYANTAALKLVRAKKRNEIIGKKVMDFIHPDSMPLIQSRIKNMLENKRVAPFVEEKFLNLKGEVFIAETKAVPFTFQGKPAILAILHDITEKKELENTLVKSEERFRTLIQESADAIQLISKDGKILYTSDSITHVLGYTPQEIQGKTVPSYLYPQDLSRFMDAFQTLLAKPNSSVTLEYRVKHKNGSWAWIEATGVNHLDNPSIHAIVGNFRNITRRKKIEERQNFLEEISTLLGLSIDYKTTLQNISKLLVPYFADYIRIALINEDNAIDELVAYHKDPKKIHLVKRLYESYRNRAESTHGVHQILQSAKAEIIEMLTSETMKKFESNTALQNTIAALGLISYMGVPLKVRNNVIGVITFSSTSKDRIYTKADLEFGQEIARRIAYAIENAKHFADAQKAITLRDDFISLASHELKTPITSLKMYGQLLQKQIEKNNTTNFPLYFGKIDQQINKLIVLINDLLDVSKIRNGKLDFTMEDINLNTVISDTVEAIQETTNTHTISIQGIVKQNIIADPYRIYQVLTNLLTNAIKYSPNGKKIIVQVNSEKDHAIVSVKDFGIGIDPNQQRKIFNQFYRVTNSQERTFPGLGMGLFISYEIIKRHAGSMTVVSVKGKGSQFSFTLPYKTPQL